MGCADWVVVTSQTQIEKEISLHQANVRAYQEEISSLKRENGSFAAQREQDERTISQVRALCDSSARSWRCLTCLFAVPSSSRTN